MASWASSIVPDLAGAILRGQLGNAGAALKASDWQGLSGRRDPNNMFRLSPQWPVPLNMRNIQRLAYASHLGASRYTPIQSSQDWVEKRVCDDRVFFNFCVLVITIYIPSVTEEKDNSDLRFQTGVSPSGADHPP